VLGFRTIGRAAWRLVVALGMVLLAVLVVTTVLQVLSRYVLQRPIDWTEEVARYVFVWVAMIGAGAAARDRVHFFVDLFLERVPSSVRRASAVALGLVSSTFLLIVAWAGFELAISNQAQESPVLNVPMSVPYLAIPVGLALMAMFTLQHAIRDARGAHTDGTTADDDHADTARSATDR
jgi:TRAP-type transport system small permease protein